MMEGERVRGCGLRGEGEREDRLGLRSEEGPWRSTVVLGGGGGLLGGGDGDVSIRGRGLRRNGSLWPLLGLSEESRWRFVVGRAGGESPEKMDGDVSFGKSRWLGLAALLVFGLACARGLCFGSSLGRCLPLVFLSFRLVSAVTVARCLMVAFPLSLAARDCCFLLGDCWFCGASYSSSDGSRGGSSSGGDSSSGCSVSSAT